MLGSDGAPCNNRLDLSGDLRLAMNLASVKGSPSGVSIDRWNRIAGRDAADFYGFQGFREDTVEIALTGTEEEEHQSTPTRKGTSRRYPGREGLKGSPAEEG